MGGRARWALGLSHVAPGAYNLTAMSATAFKLDIPAALNLKGGLGVTLAEIIFVFLFVDLFDNVGTLVAVTKKANLVAADGTIPRLNSILLALDPPPWSGPLRGVSTCDELCRERCGRRRRRSDGPDERGRRRAVPDRPGFRAPCAGDPQPPPRRRP